jgi:peptidase E
VATVYTGPADVQSEFGTIFYNASGAQDTADATCLIDPDTNGTLPAVQVNDIVAVTGGETYTVVHEANWNMAPKHLELTLKRGKLTRKA